MIDLIQSLLQAIEIQLTLGLCVQDLPKLVYPSILCFLVLVVHSSARRSVTAVRP